MGHANYKLDTFLVGGHSFLGPFCRSKSGVPIIFQVNNFMGSQKLRGKICLFPLLNMIVICGLSGAAVNYGEGGQLEATGAHKWVIVYCRLSL